MQEAILASICSRLTRGHPIQVRTLVGRILEGEFFSYENTGIMGVLMLTRAGNTFCLSSEQIDRIFLIDEENIEDTLSPSVLD